MFDKEKLARIIKLLFLYGSEDIVQLRTLISDPELPSVLEWLRKELRLRIYPVGNYDILNLSQLVGNVKCSPLLNAKFIYDVTGGIAATVSKDIISPSSFYISLFYPTGDESYLTLFQRLAKNELCFSYEFHPVNEKLFYGQDYENFNFENREFGPVKERSSLNIYKEKEINPDYVPDWYDVIILGKKQERSDYSLREISADTGLPFKEVVRHWTKHVQPNLIMAYNIWLFDSSFRVTVVHQRDLIRELVKIPTTNLTLCSNEHCYSAVYGQSNQLLPTLTFLSKLSSNNSDIGLYISPLSPKWEYTISGAIPYDYFTMDGKWNFDVDSIIEKTEPLLMEGRKIVEND